MRFSTCFIGIFGLEIFFCATMTGDFSSLRPPRSTGIPKLGSLKPPTDKSVKTKLAPNPRSTNGDSLSANKTLSATENQNSLESQHTNPLKSPVKSLIRQYQASPTKQASSKANKPYGDLKTNSISAQDSYVASNDGGVASR